MYKLDRYGFLAPPQKKPMPMLNSKNESVPKPNKRQTTKLRPGRCEFYGQEESARLIEMAEIQAADIFN